MNPKNTTLFGGKTITVNFEPAAYGTADPAQEIKVRQIPVRDYEAGFKLIEDEPALVGFLCGKDRAWALTTTPESYEEILTAGREVNTKGFFSSCRRLTERAEKTQAAMIGLMANLPPETLKLAMEAGMRMQNPSSLPTSSRGFVPPPAR